MTAQQLESAINTLCLSGNFWSLYQLIKDSLPGARAILASDQTADQKRRELLRLLKGTADD